jgi:predicted DNA-binding transcriptional regulator YafY
MVTIRIDRNSENDTPDRLPWGQRQRLEFIEFRLFWEGALNRSEITERFNVSVPQASTDLSTYRALAPLNVEYNASQKRYLVTPHFQPRLIAPNAERYLAQLRAISDGVMTLADSSIAGLPDLGIMPVPSRRIDPMTLRAFLKAVRSQRSINVEYQSMNDRRPDPMWREITPHAFGWDGFRWHARAFCHTQQIFKDFIISRCLKLGEFGDPKGRAEDDVDWNSIFDVVLIPNPRLSPAQRRTVELDYGMSEGKCLVPVRHALLYYFDKRLRLDVAEKQDRPKETPVVIENREQYDRILKAVSY